MFPAIFCSFCSPPGEHQPPLSSDSDTSLILPLEVSLSDVELSAEAEQEEAKSWVAQPGCYRGTASEGAPMELNIDQDQDGGGGIKRKQNEHEQYFPPYGLVESQKKKGLHISLSLVTPGRSWCLFFISFALPHWKKHTEFQDARFDSSAFSNFLVGSLPLYTHIFQSGYI